MEVTLGGDRLGSGNKMKQEMHNYNRASFNQEQDWKSSMAPGILYPFLCIPMTNGDSMDIDLDAFVATLPTKGPLFGSFKLQADIFSIPMRLYNGILHNNPINIGMKMNQIYFPKLLLQFDENAPRVKGSNRYDWQINNSSLLKYLGLSGIGNIANSIAGPMERKINAIPILGYYDIFKNYYANKQETYAYVIGPDEAESVSQKPTSVERTWRTGNPYATEKQWVTNTGIKLTEDNKTVISALHIAYSDPALYSDNVIEFVYRGKDLRAKDCKIKFRNIRTVGGVSVNKETDWMTFSDLIDNGGIIEGYDFRDHIIRFKMQAACLTYIDIELEYGSTSGDYWIDVKFEDWTEYAQADIVLKRFPLENIDSMRNHILSATELGEEFSINDYDGYEPYAELTQTLKLGENIHQINGNSFAQNGLVVKTYQSDIFQNWIDTEWIEGENGIAAISAVAINNDSFQIDALNLAEKVYNMLNRIAISGGTYEDWQEAVYTQEAVRKAETPIYEGGMSGEIMFEQVISTAETDVQGDPQALGSLGGKGTLVGTKGGKNIHIKAREPIFVMGIVSITPRICYTQGNEWYLTNLDTYDDLHKPALDQIGFQDLMCEQFAWWGRQYYQPAGAHGSQFAIRNEAAGKIVAWSNYMTAVDKAFGDFASPDGKGFMVLSRNYEMEGDERGEQYGEGGVLDVTTYIDPAKFNYAFAYSDLAAQNFWVQIHSKVTTRRVMSAHQIPNL